MTNHCSPRLTASLKSLSWCFKLSGLRCPFWHKEGCLDSSCLEQDLKSLKTWFKCEDARDPNFTDPGWIGASGHVSLAFLANFSLNAWTLTTSSGDSSAQMGFGSNGLNPTSKMSSQSWWTSELEQPYPSRFLSCTWTKSGSMCVNQASFCVLGVLPGPMEMVFSFLLFTITPVSHQKTHIGVKTGLYKSFTSEHHPWFWRNSRRRLMWRTVPDFWASAMYPSIFFFISSLIDMVGKKGRYKRVTPWPKMLGNIIYVFQVLCWSAQQSPSLNTGLTWQANIKCIVSWTKHKRLQSHGMEGSAGNI